MARESIQCLVCGREAARIASGMPGASRSITARVASGVRSFDARSLRVLEGTGGVQELGDEDKVEVNRTIDDEVLKGQPIEFRSTEVQASDGGRRLRVRGTLKMAGNTNPVEFELGVGSDGQIAGGATLKQTDWGIKPYSGLFGALKVADEVEVVVEASPP